MPYESHVINIIEYIQTYKTTEIKC